MFCIPTPHRKERDKSKTSNGTPPDFSQSVSALHKISTPGSSPCVPYLCRSDSNISALQSFSLIKSAVKIKSALIGSSHKKEPSTANCVEAAREVDAFGATADLSFIDGDMDSISVPIDVSDENGVSVCNESCAPILICNNSSLHNNSIKIPSSDMLLPALAVINHIRADDELDSSSGNSSSSDAAVAPMASPERLTPPESGMSSPIDLSSPDVFFSDSAEVSPTPKMKYKLLREGDIQVCHLNHTRTIVSKVLSSKFLRRWENHHIYLSDTHISSKTPTGFLENSVAYSSIEEMYVVHRWDGDRFCIRLVIPDGSILLQANSASVRDQWLYSIQWKRSMHKYRSILWKPSRSEVILKETKNLVQFAVNSPVLDECSQTIPIAIISALMDEEHLWDDRSKREELISIVSRLLDNTPPTSEMCRFFSDHCNIHPRSPVVTQVLTSIVQRILKRNVDFGKSPLMRRFVADFLSAVHSQNNGDENLRNFITGVHGSGSSCPHPRVLPNLVATTLAAIFSIFEQRRRLLAAASNETDSTDRSQAVCSFNKQLQCYLTVFLFLSEVEDWKPGLAALLQPVPLPEEALEHDHLTSEMSTVVRRIGTDPRCGVHSMVLGVRAGKEGWLHVYCPSNASCSDGGVLWCEILRTLLGCCCRRKSFLSELVKQLGALLLVSLRDHAIAQDILCLMLEWMLLPSEDQQLQAVTTLQSTDSGKAKYRELCVRQDHLRELQQKGGPRKLTLPSRSTDEDVARLLSCGCFGNLECLSLAFTHVTSACANHLIQLPSLRYLNLWATQFGDAGLLIITEHLDRLQVLNLCETPVSDKGISALVSMKNLKKLNLNSTKLSLSTLERLKKGLPHLQELDVRYTDAW